MSEHELLPWHLNGTLSPEEQERFLEHLSVCAGCRGEMTLLRSLQEQIRRHGEAFFSPHPAPETIVTGVLEGLPEPQAEEMRRHLSFCATCAAEVWILREGRSPTAQPRGIRARLPAVWRRRMLSYAAAAAIVLGVALPLWYYLGSAPSRSNLVSATYIEPPQRAGAGNRVLVPAGVPLFQIIVPAEPPDGDLPLSLEIHDSAGSLLLSRNGIRDLYRGQFLLVICDREDFPDGEYKILIGASPRPGAPRPAPIEFTFRVQTR